MAEEDEQQKLQGYLRSQGAKLSASRSGIGSRRRRTSFSGLSVTLAKP